MSGHDGTGRTPPADRAVRADGATASAGTLETAYDVRRHPAQLIRRAHQRGAQLFNQSVETPNLTATQFATLATMLQSGPLPQSQVGRQVSMDPSTTSHVVQTLLRADLIRKERSPDDRRTSVVALTDKGRDCAERNIPVSRAAGERLLAPLTPGERALFLELLDKIVAPDHAVDPAAP